MDKTMVIANLDLIASLATTAKLKVAEGKYWEGELEQDLGRISQALTDLTSAAKRRS